MLGSESAIEGALADANGWYKVLVESDSSIAMFKVVD